MKLLSIYVSCDKCCEQRPDTKFGQLGLPNQMSPPVSPDEEEPESEDDVPYFSDVEAMVRSMKKYC